MSSVFIVLGEAEDGSLRWSLQGQHTKLEAAKFLAKVAATFKSQGIDDLALTFISQLGDGEPIVVADPEPANPEPDPQPEAKPESEPESDPVPVPKPKPTDN